MKYDYIEPRTEVSDAALASGDLNAWKQVLGLHINHLASPPRDPTQVPPSVEDDVGKHDESDFNNDDTDDDLNEDDDDSQVRDDDEDDEE